MQNFFFVREHGRDVEIHAELALDANGKVLAYRVRSLANMGAYAGTVGILIQLMIGPWVSTSIYDIRTIDFDLGVFAITTDTVSPRPMPRRASAEASRRARA